MVNQIQRAKVPGNASAQQATHAAVRGPGTQAQTILNAAAQAAEPLSSAPKGALRHLVNAATGGATTQRPTIQYDPRTTAVVGLPGDVAPQGPDLEIQIPLLQKTTAAGRAVELGCIQHWEDNKHQLVADYLEFCKTELKGTFEVDAAKMFFLGRNKATGQYDLPAMQKAAEGLAARHGLDPAKDGALLDTMLRATYNAEMHQVANAIAKAAFEQHLSKLPEGSQVMVTCGGCASGKSYAIEKGLTSTFTQHFPAIYDAAGEQSATENEWLLALCDKYKHNPVFVYVQGPVELSFKRAVERALQKGRMVDLLPFVNSYVDGAANFMRFLDKYPDVQHVLMDNSGSAPAAMTRKDIKKYPSHADVMTALLLYLNLLSSQTLDAKVVADFRAKFGAHEDAMITALKEGITKMGSMPVRSAS